MKYKFTFALLLFFSGITLLSQTSLTPYYSRNEFQLASPGALKFGLYGTDNPALLSYVRDPDLLFTWSDQTDDWNRFKKWGLFAAVPHFGFGVVRNNTTAGSITDYSISMSGGNRSMSAGISYNWTGASNSTLDKSDLFTFGTLVRPIPFLSVGACYTSVLNVKGWEGVGEIGAGRRPFDAMLQMVAEMLIAG